MKKTMFMTMFFVIISITLKAAAPVIVTGVFLNINQYKDENGKVYVLINCAQDNTRACAKFENYDCGTVVQCYDINNNIAFDYSFSAVQPAEPPEILSLTIGDEEIQYTVVLEPME